MELLEMCTECGTEAFACHVADEGFSSDHPLYGVSAVCERHYLADKAEGEYYTAQMARGKLAFAPEAMPCYWCTHRKIGKDPGMNEKLYIRRTVTDTGVSLGADPTEWYLLSCGHTVI